MTTDQAIKILNGAIKKPNTKDGYLGQAITMAIDALENQPVRCKDCKYWFNVPVDFPVYDGYKTCDKDGLVRHKSFFCANGKLRGNSE